MVGSLSELWLTLKDLIAVHDIFAEASTPVMSPVWLRERYAKVTLAEMLSPKYLVHFALIKKMMHDDTLKKKINVKRKLKAIE